MSLLNRGTDLVTVYPETVTTDTDGNTVTRPGTVGIVCRAVVQPLSSTEGDDGIESKYRLRLVGYRDLLEAQSAVEWNGKRYSIVGDGQIFNGSPRTRHIDYVMSRK